MTTFHGGCLCGAIRFAASGPPQAPHTCSCGMCRRHTGALTVAWVEFPSSAVAWTGPDGAPRLFRSSRTSSRAFCATCGSSIGAVDDAPVIALLLGAFDAPAAEALRPGSHAHPEARPSWWRPEVTD